MADYVYQPAHPYSAYLQMGGPAQIQGAPHDGEAVSSAAEERWVGHPEPGALPEVIMELQEWHTGIDGVDTPFRWGACGCLLERGQFVAPVAALKKGARTAAERWAIDQFDLARDAFRHGHFAESLELAQAALDGRTGQEGNPKDYRALFLLGLLRLGTFTHRSPGLLNLEAAEDAFVRAGRNAAPVQPPDAAWAFVAAAWAAYCRGECHRALAHARLALTLRGRFGEAHYLAAKILMRERQADAAMPSFAAALAVHPSFAGRALRDADFAPHLAKLEPALEAERLRLSRRAEAALAQALDRAVQSGLWESREQAPLTLPPGSGAANACGMLTAARKLSARNTLYGFMEAETLAARAAAILTDVVSRSRTDRRQLEQAVRQATQAIGQFSHLEAGARPLGAGAAKELKRAGELLGATEPAIKSTTLREFLTHHDRARTALAGALEALEGCKRIALEEANAARAELEAELLRSAGVDEAWTRYISKGAGLGLGAGLLVALVTTMNSSGSSIGDEGALIRGVIVATAISFIGAVLGAFIGPLANSNSLTQRQRLESARSELEEAIHELASVPLGNVARR